MSDSVLEHAVLAEGAALAADHKHRRKLPNCANCGFAFAKEPENPDNFCPRCGQENHELNVSFKHLVLEFLEGTLHFDSKFFQSIKSLLFKPGFLTREFNIGRRAGYVPPIRLYVFTSFLFFLLLSWQVSKDKTRVAQVNRSGAATSAARLASADTTKQSRMRVTFSPYGNQSIVQINFPDSVSAAVRKMKTNAQIDSFLLANKIEPSFFTRIAAKQAARISGGEDDTFINKAIKNTSLLMFVLMPAFGLMLGLAYGARKRHYVEFLMFALHFHTFLFILAGLYLLLPNHLTSTPLDIAVLLIPVIYLAIALRRVYPERWRAVLLKTVLVTMVYIFILSVMLMATMLISFALF